MHPEIVKDNAGDCDVCGMSLVRAESLGYGSKKVVAPALVIPVSAPLITGKRAVVYKADPQKEGSFTGLEIQLGPRAGDYYIVLSGLKENDRVVTNGNFKIDSAIQIQARPSMMNPLEADMPMDDASHDDMSSSTVGVSDSFRESLVPLYKSYFATHDALSRDSTKDAVTAVQDMLAALDAINYSGNSHEAHIVWDKEAKSLRGILSDAESAESIVDMREYFQQVSETLIQVARVFGVPDSLKLYLFHCPMAFNDRGAAWIQDTPDIANPYFGSAMFSCGTQTEIIDHK